MDSSVYDLIYIIGSFTDIIFKKEVISGIIFWDINNRVYNIYNYW